MNLQVPSLSRYQVSFFTLSLLAALFGVYYFVYVANRKEYLHQRAFRNLVQDGQNLHERYRTVVTNARLEISYRRAIHKDRDPAGHKALFIHLPGEYLKPPNDKNTPTPFPVKGRYNQQLQYTSIALYDPDGTIRKPAGKAVSGPTKDSAGGVSTAKLTHTPDTWEIHFEDTVRVVEIRRSGTTSKLQFKMLPGNPKHPETLRIAFRIKLEDFVRMCLTGRGEVYDEYLLWQPGAGVIFSTAAGGLKAEHDTLTVSKLFHTNAVHNVEIGGVPYKLFTQQVQIGPLDGLVLGGLIREQHYRAQVYEVSMFTILLSLLCMLILVLGYPFIKLRVMSAGERLQPGDAFFCTFSLVVGSFLLFLLTLSGYVYTEPERIMYHRQLEHLATSLSGAFSREMELAYQQLTQYKGKMDTSRSASRRVAAYRDHPNYPIHYPYFDHVYTVDYAGNRRRTLNTDPYDKPFVRVADREYFKRILEGRTWNLGTQDAPRPCVLEPIFNRLTGENMAVLSIPYHSGPPREPYQWGDSLRPVLAMVMKPYSVLQPVLPAGYGFCLMDGQGRVWFHSQSQKNLQEQFVKECGEDRELQAALNGNAARYLNLTYNGQQCLAFGTPLSKVPLYLVVFHQEDHYKSIRTMATSMSVIYYLLALLPLVVLVLAHKGTFGHTPLLRGENFAFRWLSPQLEKKAHYLRLLAVFSGLAALESVLLFLHVNEQDLWFGYALTIVTSFAAARSLLFNDARLTGLNRLAFWFVYGLLVLLLGYQAAEEWTKGFPVTVQPTAAAVITGLIGAACAAGMHTLHAWARTSSPNSPANGAAQPLGHLYPASLFAWVVLAGVLPALAFYKINYQREHQMAASHTLLQLVRDFTTRKARVEKQFAYLKDTKDTRTLQYHKSLLDSMVTRHGRYLPVDYRTETTPRLDTAKAYDYQYAQFYPMLRLRPLYNQIVTDNHLLLKPAGTHQAWRWSRYPARYPASDAGHSEALSLTYRGEASDPVSLTASLPGLGLSYLLSGSWWGLVLLLTTLTVLLGLLYALIRYAVTQLFNFAVFDELHRSVSGPTAFGTPQQHCAQPQRGSEGARPGSMVLQARELTYWSGAWLPPATVLSDKLKESGWKEPFYLYDLNDGDKMSGLLASIASKQNGKDSIPPGQPHSASDDPKQQPEQQREETPIVIMHFEQLGEWAADGDKFSQATNWLQEVLNGPSQVMIFSLKDHASLRSGMVGWLPADEKQPDGKGKSTGGATPKGSSRYTLHHLDSSLSNFQEKHFHLRDFQAPVGKDAPRSGVGTVPDWQQALVREECEANGQFLGNIGRELLTTYLPQHAGATRAGILLKIQALAGLHYAGLWQSCTRQEQYALYDLAQDGLVNAKNVRAITALLEKGLLVYDGSIRLMNRSFRNYILTRVEPDEGLQMEREVRAKGSWNELRSALLLVISAIVVFIFLTQRETYNQLVAALTTLTAGIPLLLRFVGTFKLERATPTE